ncbi:MAG: divalent-cation tolerance protein CutA [Candidatus Kapaibacteriota bacterium]|jgi:periplasmic divalent cation tolerance protein
MEKNQQMRIVFVTANHFENAKMIAKNIISEQLAACCSVIPNVTSFFLWDDNLNEENEYILMIKTNEEKIADLESRILQLHEYDVPEIISVSADSVNSNYLDWINNLLKV